MPTPLYAPPDHTLAAPTDTGLRLLASTGTRERRAARNSVAGVTDAAPSDSRDGFQCVSPAFPSDALRRHPKRVLENDPYLRLESDFLFPFLALGADCLQRASVLFDSLREYG